MANTVEKALEQVKVKDYEGALRSYKDMELEGIFGQAACMFRLGEYDAAIQHVNRCLAINPAYERAVMLQRNILTKLDDLPSSYKTVNYFNNVSETISGKPISKGLSGNMPKLDSTDVEMTVLDNQPQSVQHDEKKNVTYLNIDQQPVNDSRMKASQQQTQTHQEKVQDNEFEYQSGINAKFLAAALMNVLVIAGLNSTLCVVMNLLKYKNGGANSSILNIIPWVHVLNVTVLLTVIAFLPLLFLRLKKDFHFIRPIHFAIVSMISASACGIFQFMVAPNILELAGANLNTFIGYSSLAIPLILSGVFVAPAIVGGITYLMLIYKPKSGDQLIQEYLLK